MNRTEREPGADVAILLPSFAGGGVERVMLHLARHFAGRGLRVHLVAAQAEGPLLGEVPQGALLVDLGARRVLGALLPLAAYLRRGRPKALLASMEHLNLIALWARRLAGAPTRLVLGVPNVQSANVRGSETRRERLIPWLARRFYPWADGIVAVSHGAADDLARSARIDRERITVIHNPVVTRELVARSREPAPHRWLETGGPPVILGVGRLTAQKDFATLVRAFALARARQPLRLIILGEGESRAALVALAGEQGVGPEVEFPGFVQNPYAFMSRASVFVLSSAWEGFGLVIVEAMACGTPVVSTDCRAGPAEILEGGKYGRLVPVGDAPAMAEAIRATLAGPMPPDALRRRASDFSLERAGDEYLRALGLQ